MTYLCVDCGKLKPKKWPTEIRVVIIDHINDLFSFEISSLALLSVFVCFVFFIFESEFGTSHLITIGKFPVQNVNGKPSVFTYEDRIFIAFGSKYLIS